MTGTMSSERTERLGVLGETIAMVGERYRSETMGTLRVAFLSALVLELCAMIGTALVAATIGVQLVDGVLGLQAGLTVLLLAPELYSPLRLVGQQFHASTDATTAFDRAFEILDGELQPTPAGRLAAPCPARKPLVMSAVSYDYPRRDGAVLQAVDLELRPGAITALIGPSGAGKSTVAMLLMGLALPSRGTIACGGLDLRAIDPDSWRSQIAWVPQRPTIFRGTVAENIALYRPAAGPREIERAARSAGVWELIQALPGGLQAAVGAGARGLSEGQAQRLALARALLADRPLLILDEPTAHLDQESAAELAGAIARAAEGRTALILAHHRSLTAIAQEVLTIDRGRLAPTPAELCGAAA